MAEFLNENVKYLRTTKNISQQALAEKIGVDRSTISRIENCEIETTIDNAIKIANALNISLSDLVNKDFKNENAKLEEIDYLYEKFKNDLTDDDKEHIKFILQKYLKNKGD